MTKTLAGKTVPAAVINIGKYLLSSEAARSTPLYPTILAIEERVSIDCARVVLGMESSEKEVILWVAKSCTTFKWRSGMRDARNIVPGFIHAISFRFSESRVGGFTFRTKSADFIRASRFCSTTQPTLRYSSSE